MGETPGVAGTRFPQAGLPPGNDRDAAPKETPDGWVSQGPEGIRLALTAVSKPPQMTG